MLQLEYKIKKALGYESEGKLLHALQIYKSVLDIDRAYGKAYIRLAALYEKLRKPEKAFSLLGDFLENIQEDSEIRLMLGQMLMNYNHWNRASEVLLYFPADEQPVVLFFLGYAYFMAGDFELSRLNLEKFITTNPDKELLSESVMILAKADIALEFYDDAIVQLNKAKELYKDNWEVYKLLGIVYLKKEMFQHSVSLLEKAAKLNADDLQLFEIMGKAYLKLSDYEHAEQYLLKYISSSEANSETYTCLGLACLSTKKVTDAMNYFDMAIALDPENSAAIEGKNKCRN